MSLFGKDHRDEYIAELRNQVSRLSDERAHFRLAKDLVQAHKIIAHLERHLRRARKKCKSQHRALRAMQADSKQEKEAGNG